MIQTCQNDPGFSLSAVLSVCCVVVILEDWIESEVEVSANVDVLLLNTGIEFNRSLSLLIIRLVNYSVTTSLIYKLDI